jgi:hypothetical protein
MASRFPDASTLFNYFPLTRCLLHFVFCFGRRPIPSLVRESFFGELLGGWPPIFCDLFFYRRYWQSGAFYDFRISGVSSFL